MSQIRRALLQLAATASNCREGCSPGARRPGRVSRGRPLEMPPWPGKWYPTPCFPLAPFMAMLLKGIRDSLLPDIFFFTLAPILFIIWIN